jgi:hypothetical protein
MKKIKQQKVVYPKISFCATTIDWTYYSDHCPIMSKWINIEDTGLKIPNINK